MAFVLDLTRVSPERAINAWLVYHGISKSSLAKELNVDPSFITYVIQGKRRSREVHAELIRLGIPSELLPSPGNGPGRPRKNRD